tara:strand:+ start:410 stop:619 length:210 start_codon:yes stop_codon:yes gene_type:complete
MNDLDSVIESLVSVSVDLKLACRGLVLDPQEVADAMEIADPDTAEGVVLKILAEMFPVSEEMIDDFLIE